MELFSEGAFADTASSLSDAAISASVNAAAAADAFIDGSAQKSVTDNKKIVVEKESIKDAASSSLEKANLDVENARSELIRLLIVEAQKKAVVQALDNAKTNAELALVNQAKEFVASQERLAEEQSNIADKEALLEVAKKELSDDPLNPVASANVDLAQAAVDLAGQLTENA